MSAREAIRASVRLVNRGDLEAAARVLDPHVAVRSAGLQRGAVMADAVLLDGANPAEVESVLAPHLDEGRGLDLLGLAHFHSASTTGTHSLSEAVGECTSASRLEFDSPCWKTANTLHLGMTQQALGSHDMAEMYLRDAYRQALNCPPERAFAALHLGLDAHARTNSDSAIRLVEEALDIRRSHLIDVWIPETLATLAIAVGDSEPDRAGKLADEAVALGRELRVRRPLAVALESSGRLCGSRQQLEEAADIAGQLGDRRLQGSIGQALKRPGEY